MTTYQAWNGRINRWVKYRQTSQGSTILQVKHNEPSKPFAGVQIKGNKR